MVPTPLYRYCWPRWCEEAVEGSCKLAVTRSGARTPLPHTEEDQEGAAWRHQRLYYGDVGSMAAATRQCYWEGCPVMVYPKNSSCEYWREWASWYYHHMMVSLSVWWLCEGVWSSVVMFIHRIKRVKYIFSHSQCCSGYSTLLPVSLSYKDILCLSLQSLSFDPHQQSWHDWPTTCSSIRLFPLIETQHLIRRQSKMKVYRTRGLTGQTKYLCWQKSSGKWLHVCMCIM